MSLTADLEPESAVGSVERARVAQVDLVLRVHELVVHREYIEPDRCELLGHAADQPIGVGQRADRIDHAQVVHVTAYAVRRGGIADDEEELELRADDRLEAELADGRNGTRQRTAWVTDRSVRLRRLEVREAAGDARLPR